MKRFLKIFAICFASVVGVISLTYGGLVLFGYFDEPVIPPKEISFEITDSNEIAFSKNREVTEITNEPIMDIYAIDNFYLTINSNTPDVTQKEINLSLDGDIESLENSGKISNGIIIIPNKVKIGEKFLVEPARSLQNLRFNETDPDNFINWIIGGHSVITAKSANNLELRPKKIAVHIDVPVYNTKVISVATESGALDSDSFSIGANFKIDAEFLPKNSKYYFMQDGKDGKEVKLKNVYVEEPADKQAFIKRISKENLQDNIFTSIDAPKDSNITIQTYCFKDSYHQYKAELEFTVSGEIDSSIVNKDKIYVNIRNSFANENHDFAVISSKKITFKKLSDLTYTMTDELNIVSKANNVLNLFVNYNDSSNLSKDLKIKFNSSSNLQVQNESKKLGLQILRKDGEDFIYDGLTVPTKYGEVKYFAYYQIKKNLGYLTFEQYKNLTKEEKELCTITYISEKEYSILSEKERANYIEYLITEEIYNKEALDEENASEIPVLTLEQKAKFHKYYFINENTNYIDLSYWQLKFDLAGDYQIKLKYFSTIKEIVIEDKYLNVTVNPNIPLPVNFKDFSPVELKIEYTKQGENDYKPNEITYDIKSVNGKSNIDIPSTNEYTEVRYFVFADVAKEEKEEAKQETNKFSDLTKYIDCKKTNNTKEFGAKNVALYECNDGILKFKTETLEEIKHSSFYICFATIKNEVKDENLISTYDIDKHSVQNIKITIIDTLKDIIVEASMTGKLDEAYFKIEDKPTEENKEPEVNTTETTPEKVKEPYYAILPKQENVMSIKLKTVDNITTPEVPEEPKEPLPEVTQNAETPELKTNEQFELLKKEFEENHIEIIAYNGNVDVTDEILNTVSLVNNEENFIEFKLSTTLLPTGDQKFVLKVYYSQNDTMYNVVVIDETKKEISSFEAFTGEATDVYFGDKEDTFKVNSISNPIKIITTIETEGNNQPKEDVVETLVEPPKENQDGKNNIAKLKINYLLNINEKDENVEGLLFDNEHNLKLTFKDKYGRAVKNGSYSLESSDPSVISVIDGKFNFGKTGACAISLKIDGIEKDVLYFHYTNKQIDVKKVEALNFNDNYIEGSEEVGYKDAHIYKKYYEKSAVSTEAYDYNIINISLLGSQNSVYNYNDLLKITLLLEKSQTENVEGGAEKNQNDIYTLTNFEYTLLDGIDEELLSMIKFTKEGFTIMQNFVNTGALGVFELKAEHKDLKISQIIKVNIKPNLHISYTPNFSEASDSYENGKYVGVYGGTKLTLDFTINAIKKVNYSLYKLPYVTDDKPIYTVTNEKNNNTFTYDSYTFETVDKEKQVDIYISGGRIGIPVTETENPQEGFIKDNKYGFNIDLHYNINPNFKVQNENIKPVRVDTKNSINLFGVDSINVVSAAGNVGVVISNLTVLGKIDNNGDLKFSNVSYVGADNNIRKVEDKEFTFVNNKLTLKNDILDKISLKLVIGVSFSADSINQKDFYNIKTSKVYKNGKQTYYYVDIDILPLIQIEETNKNFSTYNGETYLTLVSGKTYTFDDITNCFKVENYAKETEVTTYLAEKNDYQITFDADKFTSPYMVIDNNKKTLTVLDVYDVQGINKEFILNLEAKRPNNTDDKTFKLNFPVLFIPMDINFLNDNVKYVDNHGTLIEGQDDLKNILDDSWLKNNNAILDYKLYAGQDINLNEILNLKFSDYTFDIYDETSTSNSYAKIIQQKAEDEVTINYILSTNLVTKDEIIIIYARKKVMEQGQISIINIPVRIKIINSLKLNSKYPYGGNAEYIVFENTNNKEIDLEGTLNDFVPNKTLNNKRFELVNYIDNKNVNIENSNKYSFTYDIALQNASGNISEYASIKGNKLTINYKHKYYNYSIIVLIKVKNVFGEVVLETSQEIVDGHDGKITVYDNAYIFTIIEKKNFVFKKEPTEEIVLHGDEEFKVLAGVENNLPTNMFDLVMNEGSIERPNNKELNFYIVNSRGYAKAVKEIQDSATWKIVRGEKEKANAPILPIKAILIVYTKYGELKRYNLLLQSKDEIVVGELNANKDSQTLGVTVGGLPAIINSVDLLSLEEKNNVLHKGNIIKTTETITIEYVDKFNNTSKIVYSIKDKTFKIDPFSEDVNLNVNINFTSKGQTVNYETVVAINKNIFVKEGLVTQEEKDAGTSINVTSESLFTSIDNDLENYDLIIKEETNTNLVDIQGKQVRFRNTAVGGEVVLKYTLKNRNEALNGYNLFVNITYNVKTNVAVKINYPFGIEKEILPTGTTISLTDVNIDGQIRIDCAEALTIKCYSDNVTCEGSSLDSVKFTLNSSSSSGNVKIELYLHNDYIGKNYNVEIRQSWQDIIKGDLKNYEGTFNSQSQPEQYLSYKDYQSKNILDVVDYLDDEVLNKKFVLGYEEFKGKSTFNYVVNAVNKKDVNNLLSYVKDNNIITNNDSQLIKINVLLNKEIIYSYYIQFKFIVSLTRTESVIYPNKNNSISVRDLFGLECNKNYKVAFKTVEDKESKEVKAGNGTYIDYKIYKRYNGVLRELLGIDLEHAKKLNCITFQNNEQNPEIIGNGAPNDGLFYVYYIVVSYGDKFSKTFEVNTEILPNYIVESREKVFTFTTKDFALNNANGNTIYNDLNYVFATRNIEDMSSKINVYREGSNENLLVAERGNWNVTSSNPDKGIVYGIHIDDVSASLNIKYSYFGIKSATVIFKDIYDYQFEFVFKVIPDEDSIPAFKSEKITVYENDDIALDSIIRNIPVGSKTPSYIIENINEEGNGNIKVPFVNGTIETTLHVTVYNNANGDDSVVISVPFVIEERYNLNYNSKYTQGDKIQIRDNETLYLNDLYYVYDKKDGIRFGERTLQDTLTIKTNDNLTPDQVTSMFFIQCNSETKIKEHLYQKEEFTANTLAIHTINLSEGVLKDIPAKDAKKYDYFLCIENQIIPYYGNSSPNLVIENDQISLKFEYNAITTGEEKTVPLDVMVYAIKNDIHNHYAFKSKEEMTNYKHGDKFIIPYTELYGFENNKDTLSCFVLFNNKELLPIDKDKIMNDRILTISSYQKIAKFNVSFDDGSKNIKLNLHQGKNIFSLQNLKVTVQDKDPYLDENLKFNGNESFFNGNQGPLVYIDGVETNKISDLTGLSFKDKENPSLLTIKGNIQKIVNDKVYPYYGEDIINLNVIYTNTKEIDTFIPLQIFTPIVYMTDTNNSFKLENNMSNVNIGKITIATGNIISFANWASKVNVLDQNKNVISKLKDFTFDETYKLVAKVKEQEGGAKGTIDESNNLELDKTFDMVSGHISIIVYLKKLDELNKPMFELPIAEIIITPRRA